MFRHLQSVIVSYWCMQHNARVGGHMNVPAAEPQQFSSHTQDHRSADGLYRRRDEPLGQALLHKGALSCPAQSSTGRRQCNSLQAFSPWRRPATSPPPFPTQHTKKGGSRPNTKGHQNTAKRKRIQKGNFFLSEPVAFRRVYGLESYSRTSGESNHHR